MKRTQAHKSTKQVEALKRLPSALFTAALYRSGSGTHADQEGRYSKRERARHRADERRAKLSAGE
ncbi:hypothetical protein [Armatimonas sp.]|uniref:hypothetical protein n=1 Tax=Armatimonas sp. TaxID=1872638 RepID=UPI00286BA147|nr:hypothetical protein [Armatimonas sp.]